MKNYPTNHTTVSISKDAGKQLQELVAILSTGYTKIKYGALVGHLIEQELKRLTNTNTNN